MKARRKTYLTEISEVKNFAGTGIRPHNLPTQSFSIIARPYRLRLLLACMVRPQLVASTLGDLAVVAIATVSVKSNQTQSLFIQKSSCPSA